MDVFALEKILLDTNALGNQSMWNMMWSQVSPSSMWWSSPQAMAGTVVQTKPPSYWLVQSFHSHSLSLGVRLVSSQLFFNSSHSRWWQRPTTLFKQQDVLWANFWEAPLVDHVGPSLVQINKTVRLAKPHATMLKMLPGPSLQRQRSKWLTWFCSVKSLVTQWLFGKDH